MIPFLFRQILSLKACKALGFPFELAHLGSRTKNHISGNRLDPVTCIGNLSQLADVILLPRFGLCHYPADL